MMLITETSADLIRGVLSCHDRIIIQGTLQSFLRYPEVIQTEDLKRAQKISLQPMSFAGLLKTMSRITLISLALMPFLFRQLQG